MSEFSVSRADDVMLIEFSEGHRHNMWSMPRMRELTALVTEAADDPDVRALVLYSGVERSFGVGGDFRETSTFHGGDEVDQWLDDATDMYIASLRVNRPVIAAIDGYAIGIGLQIALTTDYRIGSSRCELKMPELELGIACTFGGYLLEKNVGRSTMLDMLMSCDPWPAERALHDHLLHEVVPVEDLLATALARARRCAAYAPAGFQGTKPFLNAELIEGLERVRVIGKAAHRAAFAAGAAQQNMRRVLGAAAPAVEPAG